MDALNYQVAFNKIITSISTNFINLPLDEIDGGIERALKTIGRFTGVDRSYVFLFSADRKTLDCRYEWCAEGVEPQIARMQAVPVQTLAWSNARLLNLETLHTPRVADLPPEAQAEKDEFRLQGIQSLVAVPMAYRGEALGFLGFDSVRAEKTWPEESIALLKIVGEIFVNALQHKRAQVIQAGQRQFLELLARASSLPETLHALVRLIEEQWPEMLGLVLLLDEAGRLHVGAADRLPQEYTRSIEGLQIGPLVGSCGTACFRRERTIVEDIGSDPRWDGLRALAQRYGLRACWSEPVFGSDGSVLGTFAMYYRHPRSPSEPELQTISIAAHLVGMAVEHLRDRDALQRARDELEARVVQRTAELRWANAQLEAEIRSRARIEDALRHSEARYRYLVENSNCLILQMDPAGQVTFFNRFAQEFFGYEAEEIVGRSILDTIVPPTGSDGEDLAARMRDVLAHPERYASCENENCARDGRRVWVAWTNKAVYGPEGTLREILSLGIDRTAQKRAEAALARQVQDQAVAAERNRLARELHDAVTQTLFSASLIAEVLPRLYERNPVEARRRLDELRGMTRGALAEMRTLLLELRPSALLEAEPAELFRHLADAFSVRARIPVSLSIELDCGDGEFPLPAEVKVALYRIAQEALNNIFKHAGAAGVLLHLQAAPAGELTHGVALTIQDDGRGFDLEQVPPDHLGLGIMRERAEAIGAALTLESRPGKGTCVRALWTNRN